MSVFAQQGRRDGLRTDLYQLTMAAAYWSRGMDHVASFELFNRRLLPDRGYHLACGLELALQYLEGLRFTEPDIAALRRHPSFARVPAGFFEALADFEFRGEVWAMPEGTPYFPNEPVLRITAPVIEAQLVETYLLSVINYQSLIATKAARVVEAAEGRGVVDFGSRRAHGPEAAELAARAAYVGGCSGSSNVEAGSALGIPVLGTYAHSWIMAFEDEDEAFRAYQEVFPEATTHLVDTYDSEAAVRRLVASGAPIQAVRLDSGELVSLSKSVRSILDEGGFKEAKIVVSSDLDEYAIAEMLAAGAPVDLFGVGTRLVTSYDCPALGGVYKLVEQESEEGAPLYRMKRSASKRSLPGAKQVWRLSEAGRAQEDIIGLAAEAGPPQGEPLLERVMANGKRLRPAPSLETIRARARVRIAELAPETRRITEPEPLPTKLSKSLQELTEAVERRSLRQQATGSQA